MTKRNLTDRQKMLHKKYAAMPVALIEKPLKYIRNKTSMLVKNAKTDEMVRVDSDEYFEAYEAAKKGDGAAVRRLAFAA